MSKILFTKTIPLFYWSEIKLLYKNKENYGDLLSKYLVEKISGKEVTWVHPKKLPWYKWDKQNFLAVGSIIHHATKDSIVWGSGIINRQQKIAPADFRSVRGPQTRKFLLNLGYYCPEVYGDPALLLPNFFSPKVVKKYRLGIIPHYHDYKEVAETYNNQADILVVNLMTMDVESVTREILKCEKTISSSLHGLIVSHAYGIRSVWVKFSDKLFGDGVKFTDYLESVGLPVYQPIFLSTGRNLHELETVLKTFPSLPGIDQLEQMQSKLLTVCPFHE